MKKKHLNYLKPLAYFFLIGLFLLFISRLCLFFVHYERATEVSNFYLLFVNGLRFDLILLSYLSLIPFLLLTIAPPKANKVIDKILTIYFSFFLIIIAIMELCTPEFIDQYDTRPNNLFLEYLIYPKEIFNMMLKARPLVILTLTLIITGLIYVAIKWSPRIFKSHYQSYKIRLIAFPLIGFLLFWGARGSLTALRPINSSNAVFCNDQMVNSLGLNSLFTVSQAAYAMRHEANPSKLYGKMDKQEAYERVKKYIDYQHFNEEVSPFSHTIVADSVLSKPYNVVIFLQESLGAEYVGVLGGLPLTPNFDNLSKEGTLFTNLYCTGTRSVRGIEAVITGFPPSPAESVVKLPNSQTNFFTLANAFRKAGYNTSFIYGGMANFDNMGSFFSGNGFSDIIDEIAFDSDTNIDFAFKGVWGYSDEDLATKANDYYKSLGEQSFFSLMFSTSNHEPFEFPDGRIELYEEPKNTVHNAMKYADFSIGKFFELAKKEAYFDNTIFVIVADHNTRTYGKSLVPINKFHIPALIIGPNIEKGAIINRLASQIDIPATIMQQVGLNTEVPLVGNNLFADTDSSKHRALMQFHNIFAFRVNDDIVILQPQKNPLQFKIQSDGELQATIVDEELAKDALAHVIASYHLYKDKEYK